MQEDRFAIRVWLPKRHPLKHGLLGQKILSGVSCLATGLVRQECAQGTARQTTANRPPPTGPGPGPGLLHPAPDLHRTAEASGAGPASRRHPGSQARRAGPDGCSRAGGTGVPGAGPARQRGGAARKREASAPGVTVATGGAGPERRSPRPRDCSNSPIRSFSAGGRGLRGGRRARPRPAQAEWPTPPPPPAPARCDWPPRPPLPAEAAPPPPRPPSRRSGAAAARPRREGDPAEPDP